MMAGRPRGTYALSDWEVDELLWHRSRGWSIGRLALFYGVSKKTIGRVLRRCEAARADLSHAKTENE